MKCIGELTDKTLLGTEGLADAAPRYTARAILRKSDGLYAVMYAEAFGLYSLPGGGIEANEDKLTALLRELLEETGCRCETIAELGYIYENRAYCNYTQYSYYYIVTTSGPSQAAGLTEDEQKNGTVLQWYTLEEAISRIAGVQCKTNQQKFLQARDMTALTAYKSIMEQKE